MALRPGRGGRWVPRRRGRGMRASWSQVLRAESAASPHWVLGSHDDAHSVLTLHLWGGARGPPTLVLFFQATCGLTVFWSHSADCGAPRAVLLSSPPHTGLTPPGPHLNPLPPAHLPPLLLRPPGGGSLSSSLPTPTAQARSEHRPWGPLCASLGPPGRAQGSPGSGGQH